MGKRVRFPVKGLSHKTVIFLLLLFLSIIPIIALSLHNFNNVKSLISQLEIDYDIVLLKSEINPVINRINTYTELVKLVGKLPAVLEILEMGEHSDGWLDKDRAIERYTKVINRAFQDYPDIIKIHIFDLEAEEVFCISRRQNQNFYVDINPHHQKNINTLLERALASKQFDLTVIPILVNQNNNDRLFLRIVLPVCINDETIGFCVGDIDIGILSESFPS
ncbi:MAG: hypothetical protein PQJ46_05500, partial [Spirochaetales bacterium]|nr:hypothetical protein [Spirochaetales bacterium]